MTPVNFVHKLAPGVELDVSAEVQVCVDRYMGRVATVDTCIDSMLIEYKGEDITALIEKWAYQYDLIASEACRRAKEEAA